MVAQSGHQISRDDRAADENEAVMADIVGRDVGAGAQFAVFGF